MFHGIYVIYSRLIIFKIRFFINEKQGAFPVHFAGERPYRLCKIHFLHAL